MGSEVLLSVGLGLGLGLGVVLGLLLIAMLGTRRRAPTREHHLPRREPKRQGGGCGVFALGLLILLILATLVGWSLPGG